MEKLDSFYQYFDNNNYTEAIRDLRQMPLIKEDKAWIYGKLSECYYELRRYKLGVRYGKKSLEFQKKYPLALWFLANSYFYLKDFNNSIKTFQTILKMKESDIGKKETQMGLKWAQSLKLDCHLCMAICYYGLYKDKKVRDCFNNFYALKKKRYKSSLEKTYLKKWTSVLKKV